MKKEIDKITIFEQQFVDTWFRMNFNGRLSYKQLKPNVTKETAEVEASKILSKPKVQEYVELKREQIRLKEEVELGWLVNELKNVVYDVNQEDTERDANGRITAKPDRRSKLEAIKILAKIAGLEAPAKLDVTTNGESINQITWIEQKVYPDTTKEDEANG